MIKPITVTRVNVAIDGSVSTCQTTLPAFTRKAILADLRLKRLDVMDSIERQPDGSFVVILAQEKPWTYTRHVFVAH